MTKCNNCQNEIEKPAYWKGNKVCQECYNKLHYTQKTTITDKKPSWLDNLLEEIKNPPDCLKTKKKDIHITT